MKTPKMALVLVALLVLSAIVYFGLAFFGESVVEDDVSAVPAETLATGGAMVVR